MLKRRCRCAKEQGINGLRLLSGDGSQLGRQCEGDQEVRDRQEQRVLLGQPGLGGLVLAGGAVAVATAVIGDGTIAAARTLVAVAAFLLFGERLARVQLVGVVLIAAGVTVLAAVSA